MSTTDERMEKVFRKASRMERRRSGVATPVMGVLAVLLGIGLVGSIGHFTGWGTDVSVSGLYGSSIMIGGGVGAYVVVALLAAALAVVVTLICVNRSKAKAWYDLAETSDQDNA